MLFGKIFGREGVRRPTVADEKTTAGHRCCDVSVVHRDLRASSVIASGRTRLSSRGPKGRGDLCPILSSRAERSDLLWKGDCFGPCRASQQGRLLRPYGLAMTIPYARSKTPAAPMPPPTHIVTSPYRASRRRS